MGERVITVIIMGAALLALTVPDVFLVRAAILTLMVLAFLMLALRPLR